DFRVRWLGKVGEVNHVDQRDAHVLEEIGPVRVPVLVRTHHPQIEVGNDGRALGHSLLSPNIDPPRSENSIGSEHWTFHCLPSRLVRPQFLISMVRYSPCVPRFLRSGLPHVLPPSSDHEMETLGSLSIGVMPRSLPTPVTKSKAALVKIGRASCREGVEM